MARNVIEQMLSDLDEKRERGRIAELPEYQEILKFLNADLLLGHLARTHGLIEEKYDTAHTEDAGDLVLCGERSLNVFDFMSNVMHMKTKEFMPILRYIYYRQQTTRALYYMNKVSIETQKMAEAAKGAHVNGVLSEDLFREILVQLSDLVQQLKSGYRMTPWMIGDHIQKQD